MHARQINEAVYVANDAVVKIARQDLDWLVTKSGHARQRRARLCTHKDTNASVHEMMIALERDTYVRPHRHQNKSESFHVVAGLLSVILFQDDGQVSGRIQLGDYQSGRAFYYRMDEPLYHTVIVESAEAILHETTRGPFDRADTEYAAWAPPEDDVEKAVRFVEDLR